MPTFKDITGYKFGRLTAIREIEQVRKRTGGFNHLWLWRCDCGAEKLVSSGNVVFGHTRSCGCLQKEVLKSKATTHGDWANKRTEYASWQNMIARCTNLKNNRYHRYGGRGIKVCERWLHSYENFIADMGYKPTQKHTIDRINNDKNYEPGNCKWSTQQEQAGHRSTNKWIEHNGRTMILQDWVRELKIPQSIISRNLKTKTLAQIIEKYLKKHPAEATEPSDQLNLYS